MKVSSLRPKIRAPNISPHPVNNGPCRIRRMFAVNFLPSFALSAIVKDHSSHLDLHFVNTEKCKRMVVVRDNNLNSAFYEAIEHSLRIYSSTIHRATSA
jgi:hypothetical protein